MGILVLAVFALTALLMYVVRKYYEVLESLTRVVHEYNTSQEWARTADAHLRAMSEAYIEMEALRVMEMYQVMPAPDRLMLTSKFSKN